MNHGHGQSQHQMESEPISTTVIEAIAEHKSVDPMALEQPLYDVIDPDALDAFLAGSGTSGDSFRRHVEFVYDGCTVRVSEDRSIDVISNTRR